MTLSLPADCTLVPYPDGLVEDRRLALHRGLTELRHAVQSAPTQMRAAAPPE
jgi:hypothetical protein